MKKVMFMITLIIFFGISSYLKGEETLSDTKHNYGSEITQDYNDNSDYFFEIEMTPQNKKLIEEAKRRDPNGKLLFLGYEYSFSEYTTKIIFKLYNNTNKTISSYLVTSKLVNSLNKPLIFIHNGRGYRQNFNMVFELNIKPKTIVGICHTFITNGALGIDIKEFKVDAIWFEDGSKWFRNKNTPR